MQYQQVITTKEKAICHLLLFFSLYEDETFEGEETLQVFSILKAYPLTAGVNFPEEVNVFFDYKNEIGDVPGYFQYLVQLMDTELPLLMLFHAAQVSLSDTIFSACDSENLLLLQTALQIDHAEGNTILELALNERSLKILAV